MFNEETAKFGRLGEVIYRDKIKENPDCRHIEDVAKKNLTYDFMVSRYYSDIDTVVDLKVDVKRTSTWLTNYLVVFPRQLEKTEAIMYVFICTGVSLSKEEEALDEYLEVPVCALRRYVSENNCKQSKYHEDAVMIPYSELKKYCRRNGILWYGLKHFRSVEDEYTWSEEDKEWYRG